MAEHHADRRPNHWVKDLLIPLILSVVVGISSATVTVRVSIAVIESELSYLRRDIVDLKLVMGAVQQNQIAKTRLEIVSSDNMQEIISIWTEINAIKANRYTVKDAERDIAMLRREAKTRHGEYDE